jgi:hypothetical protein
MSEYSASRAAEKEVATARMVNEVRASRKIRVGQSGTSTLETIAPTTAAEQSAADPWFVNFESLFRDAPLPPEAPAEIAPAALPSIALNSGPVNFNNGVPVGGWSQLSLYPNGWFNFVGGFHDSGAPSYNLTFVWSVWSPGHGLIMIGHPGHMAGTFESGSRDCNWNIQQNRPDIAAEWVNLSNGYSWQWNANVNWDVNAAINSIKSAIQAAQQIVSVIAIIV